MKTDIRHICENNDYAVYPFEVFVVRRIVQFFHRMTDSEPSLGTGSGAIQCLPTCRCLWFSYH